MSESTQNASAAMTVAVTIAAADPGAQVIIIDASFQQTALGVGRLHLQLQPGIYKARFKAGDRIEDKLFEVRDQPVSVHGDPLRFSSPIPLGGTSNNHEYHYLPSRTLAAAPPIATLGVGSEVFVFARDSRQKLNAPPAGTAPWAGLCIRDADHAPIFDISTLGRCDAAAGYATAKLELHPGLYFLEQPDCTHPDMMVELPFVVCEGWCTHIYVDSKDACTKYSPTNTQRVLDLAGAAMVMLQRDQGPRLDDDVGRLSEIARQGLMRAQEAVSQEDLDAMLHGKRRFPMLGLYAAHMLLCRPVIKWGQVAMIATNLSEWLGSGHPDIDVLLKLCRQHGATVPDRPRSLLWPPMLAASWDRALENQIGPSTTADDGHWLRQYRVGGSIWSCLLAPIRRRATAVSNAPRQPFLARSLETAVSVVKVARTIRKNLARPSAEDGDMDWRQLLAAALRNPDPSATPFHQAVRRRVLDLLSYVDEPLTLSDVGDHVQNLARQFKVPVHQAREALSQLRQHVGAQPQEDGTSDESE